MLLFSLSTKSIFSAPKLAHKAKRVSFAQKVGKWRCATIISKLKQSSSDIQGTDDTHLKYLRLNTLLISSKTAGKDFTIKFYFSNGFFEVFGKNNVFVSKIEISTTF
jgi:hypothetical protein